MTELFAELAAQPMFWVVGVLAAVMCVGSLFAGFTRRRPDEQTDTCSVCGCYQGHFGWCSRAGFRPDVDEMFAQMRADIDSVPLPAMPAFDAALSEWRRAR